MNDDAVSSPRGRHDREREFADAVASAWVATAMPPRPADHHEQPFVDAVVEGLGPLAGGRVLELGCGDGELTLALLDAGARVTALDISPAALGVARDRVERFRPGAPADFVLAPGERTGLPAGSFDAVAGKWVLHHVDLPAAADEVRRVLRPGGVAVFVETSALNPLLAFARRRVAGRWGTAAYGTSDERPITRADIDVLRRRFASVELDFPNFVLFYLLDRHIARWRWERFSRACLRLDAFIARRLASRGRWSYYLRLRLRP